MISFLYPVSSIRRRRKDDSNSGGFFKYRTIIAGWWWCRHSVWPWFTTVLLLLLANGKYTVRCQLEVAKKRCELSFFHSISLTHAKLQRRSQRYVCTSKSASRSYPSSGIYWCTGVGATSVDASALDRWRYNCNWMKFGPIVERAAHIYCRQKCIDWLFFFFFSSLFLSLSPSAIHRLLLATFRYRLKHVQLWEYNRRRVVDGT